MSSNPAPSSASASSATNKLLPMDVIELTLMLKSIGFRLDSIDFNAQRFSGGKISDLKADDVMASSSPAARDANFISVDISCGKSKIISRLSFKLSNDDQSMSSQCTCPKKDAIVDNSFWEIQSSGSFVNQRRSLNVAAKKNENGIDNDTSSNLLPVLSEKSISLTQVLAQVILNQYQNDIQFGEAVSTKRTDVRSIINALGYKALSAADDDKHESSAAVKADEFFLETPLSSLNVSPDHTKNVDAAATEVPEIHLNAASNDAGNRNMALEDTVNTEAFVSPKNDMFTSSPNGDYHLQNLPNVERDANIIHNLNQARHFVDATLLLMKLNVTRNLSHDSSTLLTVTPHLPNNMNGSRFNLPASRPSVGPKCAATNIVNARVVTPTVPSGNRPRKLPVAVKSESAATSRSNSSASSIGRPAVISKLASVKRAATNVANRTVGSTSALRSSSNAANGLTLNKSRLAANSSMASRRNSAAAMNVSSLATTGAPALNPRRSVGSIKPLKPPVILVSKK